MMFTMYTLSDLRTAIEFAPNSGGPTNPDLIGWTIGDHTICNDCSGRIAGRGCGYMLRGAVPIWDDVVECALKNFHKEEFPCPSIQKPCAPSRPVSSPALSATGRSRPRAGRSSGPSMRCQSRSRRRAPVGVD